jgi:prepilin peptidase CpaA
MGLLNASFLNPVRTISWVAGFAVLTGCAGTDLKDRRIPNELVAAVAIIGLVQGLALRPGWVWLSLLVAAILFCGLGILSHHRVIGGGDVKLISAVTMLVPPERAGHLLIEIALAGGGVSCCYLAARYGLKKLSPAPSSAPAVDRRDAGFAATMEAERVRIAAGDPMPYAIAVLGGVIIYATGGLF